jgi:hypothetical protein
MSILVALDPEPDPEPEPDPDPVPNFPTRLRIRNTDSYGDSPLFRHNKAPMFRFFNFIFLFCRNIDT